MSLEPIPQPPTYLYGMLANLPEIDPSFPLSSFWRLHALYGPIFQLDLISRRVIVVSSYELAHEVMDDEKFEKAITAGLKELRALNKDALFTAYPHEPASHIFPNPTEQAIDATTELVEGASDAHAGVRTNGGSQDVPGTARHRLAVDPAVGQIRAHPRHRHGRRVHDTLAFDTIGLCAFNYRFNDFYAEHMHPFAAQMAAVLLESGKRANRTQMENRLRLWSNKQLADNIAAMHALCDDLVASRKAHPEPDVNDLLNTMLNSADPVTGEKLDDENIRNQMVTFLIAGHETTSGTLSYLFYNLLKNPDKLHKAQQEVDAVLGDDAITVKHLDKLKYVDACLKETLRLNGPIGQVQRRAKHDTVLGGRYAVSADHAIVINLRGLHSDPAVWGEDATEFKPERMLHMDRLPPDAWKPFGIGMRSCIGRAFAEQEMLINVALILQRFQVEMDDPSYVLVNKATLTIKPDKFFIKVRRRPAKGPMVGLSDMGGAGQKTRQDSVHGGRPAAGAALPAQKMSILYGSNAGTCKAFAEDLATHAPGFGFDAEVMTLDQATENVTKDQPVVVVTSSYEGKPPDNAAKFVAWLQSGGDAAPSFEGVRFAVFGVGNSEWVSTYQRVPKLVERRMRERGGKAVVEPCWADVKEDCMNEWENWTEKLWKSLAGESGGGAQTHAAAAALRAEVIKHDIPVILGGKEMSWAVVKSARSLGGQEVGLEKREVEIELPHDTHYSAGDYFVVLPLNPPPTVARVLHRFGLHPDDMISISDTRKTFLQSPDPIGAHMFFAHRVELNAPPTQRQLATMLAATTAATERQSLESLAATPVYHATVIAKNYSILDILEDHPSACLPLAAYIDMLKPLAPRQYSIASSPLAARRYDAGKNAYSISLIYDVHVAPAWASPKGRQGDGRTFRGVASSYLANLAPGDRIHGYVRATNNPAFRLPVDGAPVIMVAAGSGIAPMRGFVEERVALAKAAEEGGGGGGAEGMGQKGKKKKLPPALLYFGCRDFEKDFICKDELLEAEKAGVVGMRSAFSKRGPEGGGGGVKYAYERLWEERDECAALFRDGAKILLCGSAGKLAKSTAETLKKVWLERNEGKTDEEAEEWLERQKEDRYVTDVFD